MECPATRRACAADQAGRSTKLGRGLSPYIRACPWMAATEVEEPAVDLTAALVEAATTLLTLLEEVSCQYALS